MSTSKCSSDYDYSGQSMDGETILDSPVLPLSDTASSQLSKPELDAILSLVQQQEQLDFSQYKVATLNRRIYHHMQVVKIAAVPAYIDYLTDRQDAIKDLKKALLINTTCFFRDPKAWTALQESILPSIIEQLDAHQPLRVWVAACSTGEEAYSMLIAINEVMRRMDRTHLVKLFATDIDQNALDRAAQGIFSKEAIAEMDLKRLEQYFIREGSVYRIKPFIRCQAIFACHDLTQHPGFSNMHIISCRNLLIYMQTSLQEKVLKLLHFSLKAKGLLWLGTSDHLGQLNNEFQTIDHCADFYRKGSSIILPSIPSMLPIQAPQKQSTQSSYYRQLLSATLKLRFGDRPLTCLLINSHHQMQNLLLNQAYVLQIPLGEVNLYLSDVILPSLREPLNIALQSAKHNRSPVNYDNIAVSELQGSFTAKVWVGPFRSERHRNGLHHGIHGTKDLSLSPDQSDQCCWLVIIELQHHWVKNTARPWVGKDFYPYESLFEYICVIEDELQETRGNLCTMLAELERSKTEQARIQEKFLFSNANLQATNEELQTLNEELQTVNTQHRSRIEELTAEGTNLEELLHHSEIGVVYLDPNYNICKFTSAVVQAFNLRPSDVGRPLTDFVHHLELENLVELLERGLHTGQMCEAETMNTATGDRLLVRIFPLNQQNHMVQTLVLMLIKIHELPHSLTSVQPTPISPKKHRNEIEHKLQKRIQQLEMAQNISQMGDWEFDVQSHHLRWSTELFRLSGYDPAYDVPPIPELLGQVHEDDRPLLINLVEYLHDSQKLINLDIRLYPLAKNTYCHINIMGKAMVDMNGKVTKLYGTVTDITGRKEMEEALQHQAFFDPLTHLPNRAFFLKHLKLSMIQSSRDHPHQFAVFYLDVDDFKEINDTLGHAAGDQLLIEVARRLETIMRPGDIVARLGGDEFAILLKQCHKAEIALEVANRIHQAIATPISLPSTQVSATMSIGIAIHDSQAQWHSDTILLENADMAMYQAKRMGEGNTALFNSAMRTDSETRISIKHRFPQALAKQEFILYYQPLIHLSTRAVVGFEALVRWQHPQEGMLTPMKFLPIIQDANLMLDLETELFRQACYQLQQWNRRQKLRPDFRLNINISPRFLKHAHFLPALQSILHSTGVNPRLICLELTEHSLIEYSSTVDNLLRALKDMGFSIALDDFGTGYSSLSCLYRLPIDGLKIDQSFVQTLNQKSSLGAITNGIIALAKELQLSVTAEGIETLEQWQLLNDMECDYGQGYFVSHPLPAAEAMLLLVESLALLG